LRTEAQRKRTALTVVALVVIGALGSAAALALDPGRLPAGRANASQVMAPHPRGAAMMQPGPAQVLYVPPVTIAAPWPEPAAEPSPAAP